MLLFFSFELWFHKQTIIGFQKLGIYSSNMNFSPEATRTWTQDGKTPAASLDLRKIGKIFSRILVHAGVRFSSGLVGG